MACTQENSSMCAVDGRVRLPVLLGSSQDSEKPKRFLPRPKSYESVATPHTRAPSADSSDADSFVSAESDCDWRASVGPDFFQTGHMPFSSSDVNGNRNNHKTGEVESFNIFDEMASTGIHIPSLKDSYLRFNGHFSHSDLGESIPVDVILEAPSSGRWTIQAQTEEIEIKFEGGLLIFSEKDGPTEFVGKFDRRSGLYSGEVIQDSVRGGRFHLQPYQSFPCIAPLIQRKIQTFQDVKVIAVHKNTCDREIASFPRIGLERIGDVLEALRKHFGSANMTEVSAVACNNGLLRAQCVTERLGKLRSVHVIGFDMSLL